MQTEVSPGRRRGPRRIAAAAALLIVSGAGLWWWTSRPPLPIRRQWPIPGVSMLFNLTAGGRNALIGNREGGLRLFRLENGASRVIGEPGMDVLMAWPNPDGQSIIALYRDRSTSPPTAPLAILDIASGEALGRIPGDGARRGFGAFAHNGMTLYTTVHETGPRDARHLARVEVRDASTGDLIETVAVPPKIREDLSVRMTGEGRWIVGTDPTDRLTTLVWSFPDFAKRAYRAESDAPRPSLGGIGVSADGRRVAARLPDGSVWLWDGRTGARLAVLRGAGPDTQASFHFSADGRFLAASEIGPRDPRMVKPSSLDKVTNRLLGRQYRPSDRYATVVWDLEPVRRIARLPRESEPRFTPDGKSLVTGRIGEALTVWALPEAESR